jgi:hypothetical protein
MMGGMPGMGMPMGGMNMMSSSTTTTTTTSSSSTMFGGAMQPAYQ